MQDQGRPAVNRLHHKPVKPLFACSVDSSGGGGIVRRHKRPLVAVPVPCSQSPCCSMQCCAAAARHYVIGAFSAFIYLFVFTSLHHSTPSPVHPPPLGHYHLCPSYRPLTLYRYKWFIFIFQIKFFHHCAVADCSALCSSRQLLRRQVMPSTPHGHPHPAPPYTALHLPLLPLLVLLSKNQLLFSLFFHFFLILFLMFTITFYCGPSASIFTSVAAAASPLVFPRLQDIRRYCRYYSQLFSSLCFLSFVMSLIPAIGFVRCKSL